MYKRQVAILIEHCAGKFPLWLTPEQVKILPISDRFNEYAERVSKVLENHDIRALVDDRSEKVGKKIRDAELEKIPYMLILGENEALEGTVSVRRQGVGDLGGMSVEAFAEHIRSEIAEMLKWQKYHKNLSVIAIRRKRTPYRGRVRREDLHRINDKIEAAQVRVVGDNVEPAVMSTGDAILLARELELDLVEISPKADPPVCRIIEYKKFLYDQKKKQKEIKAKQQKVVVKEIRFGPNTDDHDFQFKLKHAKKFLQEGSKLKAYVFFRGRTIVFKERGEILLLKFAQELEEYGTVEQLPKLEGKRMTVMFNPKKN